MSIDIIFNENIFSPIVLDLRNNINIYNNDDIENNVELINKTIDDMYESDDEDIEDFYDLIMVINDIVENAIKNSRISTYNLSILMKSRIYAKKRVKQKFRECKTRNYEDCITAELSYTESVKHIWKPSVIKLIELVKEHRPDFCDSDEIQK